jgi:hypothetical protein
MGVPFRTQVPSKQGPRAFAQNERPGHQPLFGGDANRPRFRWLFVPRGRVRTPDHATDREPGHGPSAQTGLRQDSQDEPVAQGEPLPLNQGLDLHRCEMVAGAQGQGGPEGGMLRGPAPEVRLTEGQGRTLVRHLQEGALHERIPGDSTQAPCGGTRTGVGALGPRGSGSVPGWLSAPGTDAG